MIPLYLQDFFIKKEKFLIYMHFLVSIIVTVYWEPPLFIGEGVEIFEKS